MRVCWGGGANIWGCRRNRGGGLLSEGANARGGANVRGAFVQGRMSYCQIFNDHFIANFLENVTVKGKESENRPIFDEVMCRVFLGLAFLAHPVYRP